MTRNGLKLHQPRTPKQAKPKAPKGKTLKQVREGGKR